METKGCFSFLFVILIMGFLCSSHAYDFYVGGRDGWVLNPSQNFNQWAERMRFKVNDSLVFKYNKGSDSVLVVNKDDYQTCNTSNPLMKMDAGDSKFKVDRSGPFYFISGNKENCDKGQKLTIVVLAIRPKPPQTPASPPPVSSPTPSPSSPPMGQPPSPSSPPMGQPTSSPPMGQPPSPSSPPMGQPPSTSPPFPPTGQTPNMAPSPLSEGDQAPSRSPPSPSSSPALTSSMTFILGVCLMLVVLL